MIAAFSLGSFGAFPNSGHAVLYQRLTTFYLHLSYVFRDLCTAKFIHYHDYRHSFNLQVSK